MTSVDIYFVRCLIIKIWYKNIFKAIENKASLAKKVVTKHLISGIKYN